MCKSVVEFGNEIVFARKLLHSKTVSTVFNFSKWFPEKVVETNFGYGI